MGLQGLNGAAVRARREVRRAESGRDHRDWGRSWSAGALVLVVGIGVVLGGCSAPAPEVDETPSVVSEAPSPTPSPTPTPTGPVKPERPADMDRTDEVGAAAAATYFLELYPYVKGTGDLEEWNAISFPTDCEFCVNLARSAEEVKVNSQTFAGGALVARVEKIYPLDTLYGAYPLDVNVRQEEISIIGPDGTIVSADPATSTTLRVVVIHDGSDWRLMDVGETSMP